MRLRGEQGQTGAEMVGVLLLVGLIVGAIASSGIPDTIAKHTAHLICRIAGGDCEAAEPPGSEPGDESDEGDEPSGPVLTEVPLPVLPFPGSVSVKCTYSETSTKACMPPDQPGVLGESTKYSVTVDPGAADAIERGDRRPPNPVDPRTIAQGESVQLSREYYAGVGMEAEYRALKASLGYEEGTRVSSGVERVSPRPTSSR